jgi:F-type H+-transporting ATPase subunit gamma
MAQTQGLKRRIRSIKNAGQITKAMEVVAASRMRRVQEMVGKVRAYGELADSIMQRIAPNTEAQQHPYFKPGTGKTSLHIIFSSDRGLAGAFNSNVFNTAHKAFNEDKAKGEKSAVIVFGRKGAHHFARISDVTLIGDYEEIADVPEVNLFAPVLETIRKGMADGEFSSVNIIYTSFKSSLVQQVLNFQLLPVVLPETTEKPTDPVPNLIYEFEPSIELVLEEALHLYFEAKLMQSRVDSAASEYAMRMIAMGNANRNASELIDNLTLELNSLRQAVITQEIAEITGGATAIAV